MPLQLSQDQIARNLSSVVSDAASFRHQGPGSQDLHQIPVPRTTSSLQPGQHASTAVTGDDILMDDSH
jgi:hypothetical protein